MTTPQSTRQAGEVVTSALAIAELPPRATPPFRREVPGRSTSVVLLLERSDPVYTPGSAISAGRELKMQLVSGGVAQAGSAGFGKVARGSGSCGAGLVRFGNAP